MNSRINRKLSDIFKRGIKKFYFFYVFRSYEQLDLLHLLKDHDIRYRMNILIFLQLFIENT